MYRFIYFFNMIGNRCNIVAANKSTGGVLFRKNGGGNNGRAYGLVSMGVGK